MKKFTGMTLFVLIALLLVACGGQTDNTANNIENNAAANAANNEMAENNSAEEIAEEPVEEEVAEELMLSSIAEIAVADGRFTTLVTALDAAGLVETMAGEGAFTVFAPTDDAFAALPEGALEGLLADVDALTSVLLYHVVDGVVYAEQAAGLVGSEVTTLSGEAFTINSDMGNLYVNDAQIILTDIEASNGVIHVIDAVILPPSMVAAEAPSMSIAEIAVADGRFTTLVTALDAAGLVETMAGEGSFTVFAPTDDAFAALPEGALDGLLADIDALTSVLLYHVVEGTVFAEQAAELVGSEIATLSGETFTITSEMGSLYINDAMVIIADIAATNGVIHVIDAVLLP